LLSTEESYQYSQRLTRAAAKNFYYTFHFLPPERRRSIFAVYAFSRRADDAVDSVEEENTSPEKARRDLSYLRRFLGDDPPPDPLVPALRDTIQRFSISSKPFEELLAGMEMDLTKKSYQTFDELYLYCYRAASVVGIVCMEIFGYEKDAAVGELTAKLGIAMQLTNILRDVEEDLQRGRVYLPAEDLLRFDYTKEDLTRGIVDDRFRALMTFQVARAREYFRAAEPIFPLIRAESRYCPVLLMRFYSRILDLIERQGYDVLHRRPKLPWHEKIRLAGATWLQARAARRLTSRRTSQNSQDA
jgi:phytoene synthase